MKRLLRASGILIIIILAAMLILPAIFKDEIIDRAKLEMNKNLNAEVDFEDIGLSLFRSFPDFSLSLENIEITGVGEFEGVSLAQLEELRVSLNLFSVVAGNQFEIENILLKNGYFNIVVSSSGQANYDVVKATDEDTAASEPESAFKLTLKSYRLANIDLHYLDPAGDLLVHMKGINHSGKGDFTQDVVALSTETDVRSLNVNYAGVDYLSHAVAEWQAELSYNQNTSIFTLSDNLLVINDLPLSFSGTAGIPEEVINLDLQFSSPSQDLKQILSLIPAIYSEGYEDMEASGSFSFTGSMKGVYDYEDQYPAYNIKVKLKDGAFKYPDLPSGVKDINMSLSLVNETSQLSNVEINIPEATANIAGNIITARMMLTDAMTNPLIDAAINGDLNLANLTAVVPMTGYDLSGMLKAHLEFKGDMLSVEAQAYDKLTASGIIELSKVRIAGDSIAQDLRIETGKATLTPQFLDVTSLDMFLGRSDFRMKGRVDNLLGYFLVDSVLRGSLRMSSDLLDLNEFSSNGDQQGQGTVAKDGDTASAMAVIRVPQNLKFKLDAAIAQVLYDNLIINDVVGNLKLDQGVADLEQLDMKLIGGSLRITGDYDSRPQKPLVNLSYDLQNFDIHETYTKFLTIQKLAPIMKNSQGKFSTKLKMRSVLGEDMSPLLSTVVASGNLTTSNLTSSPQVLQKLAKTIGNPRLGNLAFNDVKLSYKVEDGRVITSPFDLTAGSLKSRVSGSMGLDQSLDYKMALSLPLKDIGAAGILNKVGADPNQKVDLNVLIGGTASEPKVTTSLKDIGSNVVDQVKDEVIKKIEEVKTDVIDQANQKAEALIADAEKKGDALIAQAQAQADALVNEAEKQAQRIREEANVQARKLEDEAKGNFLAEKGAKVAADKLRSEGDKRASQLVTESRNQGNKLINEAREQKVKLLEEARQNAKIQ